MLPQKSTKVNPRVRVRFRLVVSKAALNATIPLLLSWVPRPPIAPLPYVDCPPQIVQPCNADSTCVKY